MLRAAHLQHREAQFQYAMACMLGKSMAQDYDQALLWLKRSAENGWPKAESLLALCNLNGTVLFPGKDQAEGIKWLRRAAEHGDLKSQWVLGLKLIKGEGLPRNQAEALKWFRWSAEHGNPEAQNCLGYALETAEAGAPGLTEICMWYQLAANQGQSNAKINLGRLFSRFGEEQQQQVALRVQNFRLLPMPQLNPVKRNDEAGTPSLDISSRQ
jgi:TPR repeat protein